MFTETLHLAAKARKQQDKEEARRLYLLAAKEARAEGFTAIPDRLEQCAYEMQHWGS